MQIQIKSIMYYKKRLSRKQKAKFHLLNVSKAMAPHSSTLAWKIPWTEEPGRLQSMGSLRVGHDWVTSLSLSCIGEGNGNPLQCSCLENPRKGGAWWAAVYGVAQSRTRLKRLSSSSSSRLVLGFSELIYSRPQAQFLAHRQWINVSVFSILFPLVFTLHSSPGLPKEMQFYLPRKLLQSFSEWNKYKKYIVF